MDIDLLRAELERLFELDELLSLTEHLLGFDPEAVGGTAAKGSFARALTEHCATHDAVEALCDAVMTSKRDADPKVATLGLRGLPPRDEIALGERIGPFLIAKKLGEGPAGITYVARTDEGDLRLKVLRREATRDQRALHRFLTLTRLAARVRHQSLPWKLRTGSVDGRFYVAHESIDGQALAARIARTGPMHINEARDMLRALLGAIAQLHEERIVHGNLKLENVLVFHSEDGAPRVLLVDTCGDRLRTRAPANGHVEQWSVSSPKTVAPEQLRGHAPTPSSDLYSFGALLFEMLTGKPLFDTRTVADAMVSHLSEPPRPPSTVAPRGWVTRDLDELVLKLLEKDPAARPPSVASVLSLLDTLGRPVQQSVPDAPSITEEELVSRVEAVILNPESEDAALLLESSISEGADTVRVAEAFTMAAAQIETTDDEARRGAAKSLLFRAARLFQDVARKPEQAEAAYAKILALDPSEGAAEARLDMLRQELGKYDELVESLLGRAENAAAGPERASVLARIGKLYAKEIGDSEQALVALTQAFCEDPSTPEYGDEIERLAGASTEAWGEVLGSCNEASTGDLATEVRNALFQRMSRWYQDRYARPDLALQCLQAISATDPGNEEALEGLTALYRKAQQWQELGAILLRRADRASDPARGRDFRFEAATILETQLSDVDGARDLYTQVLAADPTHARATDALARLYEQSRDYQGLVLLLETQSATLRGDERLRVLCRIAELYEDKSNDDAEAIKRYTAVLDVDPGNLDALRGLDRLYSKAGRFAELLQNLAEQIGVATTPRQKMALWERVAGVHDEEFLDHDKAAYALEQVLELDPNHDPSLGALARHYRGLSRWEDLATLYERHLALISDPARKLEITHQRALVLAEELHATERAIFAYEEVLAMSPEHPGALETLARLRETAGHEDAALVAIEALAEKAETPEARAEQLKRAAKLLEGRGDRDGAILRYKRALDANPRDAGIAASLRSAYVARGDVNAAVELLEREIDAADGDRQKAELSAELANLFRSRLKDDERAERAARRALDHDPTNTNALMVLGDAAFESSRFVEAAASYEKLASRADSLEHTVAVRTLTRYVDSLARGGSTEKALTAMDTLLRLAPDDPQALARVAAVTFENGTAGRARELYSDLLGRLGETLTPAERFLATYRVGEAARRLGDLEGAVSSLEAAADLDPSSPLPLLALAAAYEANDNWAKVVDAKTRHLDLASGEERLKLLVEVGDIAAGKLSDRTLATKSLVAALDERPDDRKLLARLMQLYSEEKDWQKLVDVVLKLADFVDDPKQKAKYLQTAAMVTGQEMREYDQALEYYARVLALDPSNDKAIDDSIELCEQKGDYAATVERLKDKAKVASEAKDTARMLDAFNRLGAIYKDKLGRIGHAIDAHEAAQTLDPDNKERNQLLAELYAGNPERYMDKAVAAQMEMVRQNPYRVESYKLLRRLYTDAKNADAAWCLCQALYVLKLSDADEERFFKRMRSEDPAYAQEVLSDDDWLESLFHDDADPMLTSLFALIEPAIVATRGSTFEELGYDPRYVVDAAQHPYPVSQTLHYAAGVMGMALPPIFENPNDPTGLGFLTTRPPAIVLGSAALMVNASPQALAYVAARHLTYFRPGFYIRHLVASGTGLRSWLFAAIKMNVPQFPVAPDIEGPVREAVQALESHLAPALRDHLARTVSKLIQSGAALDLRKWVQGVDLTADRLGFLLAHDLETAVEIIRASDDTSSSMTPQARLKELVHFAIGLPYFKLRKRLGISVDV